MRNKSIKFMSILLMVLLTLSIFPMRANADTTVYKTATGSKYHYRTNCSGLNRAKNIYKSTLSKARSDGLQPCNICADGHTPAESFPENTSNWNTNATTNTTIKSSPKKMPDGNLFDPIYYANTYSDVKQAYGTDETKLYQHYLEHGCYEGRRPYEGASVTVPSSIKTMPDGNKFDPVYYATNYTDVVAALGTDENVLYQHYLNHGKAEGRLPYAGATPEPVITQDIASTLMTMSDGQLFDPIFYAKQNPDVVAAYGTDPNALYQHYYDHGKAEGRLPYNGAIIK